MFVILLTLWAFTFVRASTLDMSDCTAVTQPNSVMPYKYFYSTVSLVNDGHWRFLMVPDEEAYKNVRSQEFHIVRKDNSRTNFYVTIKNKLLNGTTGYVAKNEELTDLGKGVTSIKSGKESAIQYELSTAVVWSSDTCFAYSACSPSGNDKENLWIFTACTCELSKNDESEVVKVYKQLGASYKKLETPKDC